MNKEKEKLNFCDIFSNICFETTFNNVTIEEDCHCPIECTSISYSFSLVSTPFNPEKMCLGEKSKDYFVMREYYDNMFPPAYIRKLTEFKDNVTSDPVELCKKNINYRAEVNFKVATDTIPVTVMSRRLSFFDKMSAFGNE